LLELIGEACSERALPLLAEQLASHDEALRSRAMTGLKNLGTHLVRDVRRPGG
jgi:hypothetical protein